MMNRIKTDRMALVSVISAALGVLAVVLYGVLSADGEKASALVYVLLIVGILVQLAPAVLPKSSARDLIVTVAGWAGTILYAAALALFVTERVQWLYAIMSKMEAAPLTALFPVTIVAFCVALVAGLVALYCPNGETD